MSNVMRVEVGSWQGLSEQVFESGPLKREGKRFIGEELQTSGCEVSFNRLKAGDGYPFLHRHTHHEEVYIAVHGRGQMVVDGDVIELTEGTAVRVAPQAGRSIRAAAGEPLDYLCIQARVDTLQCHGPKDGVLVPGDVDWG